MADPATALTALKGATDLAKWFRDSYKSLNEAEARHKLADLLSALADVKIELAEVQETLVEKDRQIRELQQALETDKKMDFRDGVYYMEGDENPYCPKCYDDQRKVIHLHYGKGSGHWSCAACSNSFKDPNYKPPPKPPRRSNPWV